jgi:integrase
MKSMHERRNGDFVFPGRPGKPLGEAALQRVLKRLGITDATVHGFRSAARDWAGDKTTFAHDVIETCLAHQIQSAAEAAYRRQTALEKRAKVMAAWSAYSERPAGANVVRPQFGDISKVSA